jgi:hypothetical protein
MRRDRLEHAIRTACQIIGRPEVIVVGSQSILATFREEELPADATMSVEVDILPIADGNDETARLADLIEGGRGGVLALRGTAWLQHRRRRLGDVCAASGLTRSTGQSAEREHGCADRGASARIHRLNSGDPLSRFC